MARVAIRPSNSDDIEKIAFIPALMGAAAKLGGAAMTVGRGAMAAGKTALGGTSIGQGITAARGASGGIGSKIKEGIKAGTKAKLEQSEGEKSPTQMAGALVMQRQQQKAQERQQRLQNNMQNNLQMADRAKQNSEINTGEPMDLSWRLLKEDPLDPEERTPVDDEKIQYKFPSAGPYWTLNDRQKKVADAALDLPNEYLSEEGWDGEDFDHLFAEGHETVPDQEYKRLTMALNYFKHYIKQHMADPDSDKSPQFLESWDDPRHPWAKAKHMAFYRENEPYDHFSEGFKEANKSEPMDLAWRMLKEMSDDDIQNWVNYNLESQGILVPQEEEEEKVTPKFEMPTLYY